MGKGVKMWAVVHKSEPDCFFSGTIMNNREDTLIKWCGSIGEELDRKWNRQRLLGYRCVRVQVTEVKRKRKGGAK